MIRPYYREGAHAIFKNALQRSSLIHEEAVHNTVKKILDYLRILLSCNMNGEFLLKYQEIFPAPFTLEKHPGITFIFSKD